MSLKFFRRLLIILLVTLFVSGITSCRQPDKYSTWSVYGGSKENIHYSSLTAIDTANVAQLQVAWTYHTNDADTANHSQMQCNPVIIDGTLYATSPRLKLIAMEAATGKEKWVFDPQDSNQNKSVMDFILNNNRGVTYWADGSDKRIFYTAGAMLYSIDAATGKLITGFGKDGRIDLHDGLGPNTKDLYVAATSPGIIYKDLIIMGSRVSEASDAAPGHIRAYDIRTGAQRWIFHTIPHPGEKGYDSWEDSTAYRHIGGANCWSGFSLDEARGILFCPIGSASFDFYGGKRKGAGLFADCLLALDAATGQYRWHFQDVHHDVWDKDIPTPPALVTFTHDGKKIDAVAQPTKTGFLFVLDRETGKPIFPINEQVVPTSTQLAGEKLWPTQPIPQLPEAFVRQNLTDSDLNNLIPDSSFQDVKKRFTTYKSGNMFMPPSREGTMIFPGYDGGAEWGGPAYDPSTQTLFVNANEMAWILTMVDVKNAVPKNESNVDAGKRLYMQNCMVCHGPERKGSGNFPSLIGVNKKYNVLQFDTLLTTGRRMMPAFKQLSNEEKNAIASMVLEQKSMQDKRFVAPVVAVDSFRNLPFSITGYNRFLTKEGYPAIKPPWGTLNAISLSTGKIKWKIPLGEYPEFVKKGIATGTENYGGPIVTAGGLLFIAATRDGKFRAFNKSTGKLLWETNLPAPGFATPSVFEVGGREYIVIACGGGKLKAKSADAYVAFALPSK